MQVTLYLPSNGPVQSFQRELPALPRIGEAIVMAAEVVQVPVGPKRWRVTDVVHLIDEDRIEVFAEAA
jgi:hypothetical protein